jgi:glutamine amidotransferase-like uncharacterized protein
MLSVMNMACKKDKKIFHNFYGGSAFEHSSHSRKISAAANYRDKSEEH